MELSVEVYCGVAAARSGSFFTILLAVNAAKRRISNYSYDAETIFQRGVRWSDGARQFSAGVDFFTRRCRRPGLCLHIVSGRWRWLAPRVQPGCADVVRSESRFLETDRGGKTHA